MQFKFDSIPACLSDCPALLCQTEMTAEAASVTTVYERGLAACCSHDCGQHPDVLTFVYCRSNYS